MSELALAPNAAGTAVRRERSARRRMPLAVKLAAALVGLVVLVLLVNGAINMWLSYGQAKTAALQVQQEKARPPRSASRSSSPRSRIRSAGPPGSNGAACRSSSNAMISRGC